MKAALLGALLALAGCALGDDKPDRTCRTTADCFAAQGETCNTTTNQCELRPDAGALETEDEAEPVEAPEVSR